MFLRSLVLVVAILAALTPISTAATLKAWEDSFSVNGRLSAAANKASALVVGDKRTAFVYFDLTEIPEGSVIRYARLRLYFPSVTRPGAGLSLHTVTEDWNESVARAAPAFDPAPLATFAPERVGNKRFVSTDVTASVKHWLEDRTSNQGFAIAALPGPRPALVRLAAKEGGGIGYPAELEIELGEPIRTAAEAAALVQQAAPLAQEAAPLAQQQAAPHPAAPPVVQNAAGPLFSTPLPVIFNSPVANTIRSIQPGEGAVTRTVQSKLDELPITVRDFGAIGDGVADDTAAIQSALNAASAQRRPLFLPSGHYRISDTLVVPSGSMVVKGAGGFGTMIRQTNRDKSALTVASNVNQVTIESIRFVGLGSGNHAAPGLTTPPSPDCIDDFILRDVSIEEFAVGAKLIDLANALIERCSFAYNGIGGLSISGNSNAVTYLDSSWTENSGYGLLLGGGRGHVVITGDFGGPKQTGGQIIMDGATSCVVNGTNMEVYAGDAIVHASPSTYLVLNGVFVAGFAAAQGYSLVQGANRTTVNNCIFQLWKNGASVKQLGRIACELAVSGVQHRVDVFENGVYKNSYRTNPLAPSAESAASGQPAVESNVGTVRRRVDPGGAEIWDTVLRKADGSYEWVSLVPLQTANLWREIQTFQSRASFQNGLSANSISLTAQAAPPQFPTEGQIYYNSSEKHFYGWNGTDWLRLSQ